MCPPLLQLSQKVVTQLGYDENGRALKLEGLAGFSREAVKLFRAKCCSTCAAKAATKPSKKPAAHAIRTSGPFTLCQVG